MGHVVRISIILLVLSVAASVLADNGDLQRYSDIRGSSVVHGGSASGTKAARDTVVLIGPHGSGAGGSDPPVIGTFQNEAGHPFWNGWSAYDWTMPDTTDTTWHASSYYAINGTYSAYCGDETVPSCGGGDPVGGYENRWSKILRWGGMVDNPTILTSITVSFAYDVDSEDGYDWLIVAKELAQEKRNDIWQISGDTTGIANIYFSYGGGEYFGDNLDEVGVWFVGQTDAGWSDEDCDHPSTGLARIDDVTITATNGAVGMPPEDFEGNSLGGLERKYLGAVGSFAHILTNLDDPDVCVRNSTPQIAFIDDGVVQPSLPGTPVSQPEREYASGWAVNHTGGLTYSDERHLHNAVLSPTVPWLDSLHDGARFGFTYMTDSFFLAGEAGVFMEWLLRSTDGDEASIDDAIWQHSPFFYTGGPFYGRRFWEVDTYFVPGRTYVQVALGANEIGYVWGIDGQNGSPSPYYDNVRLETYPAAGPSLSTLTLWLANDSFPEIGVVDTDDLSRNSIRFDQAQNISPAPHEWYRNGDSITIDAVAVRHGATLTGRPRFHYKLQRNPLFTHSMRTAGLPDSGVILMDTTYIATTTVVPNRFNVDLPDTGFLFPGDVLHYYFSAEDAIGFAEPLTSTLPADVSGFNDFADPMAWSSEFTVRGLPTLTEPTPGEFRVPPIIFWDDAESESRGTKANWYGAWANLGLRRGEDYDTYYGKAPSSGIGSGLSGRASIDQLGWYTEMVYSTGHLTTTTLSNGDWGNGGDDDIALLTSWLNLPGGRDMFLTGNGLAFDLANSGAATGGFLAGSMGVTFVAEDHYFLLGGQQAPRVLRAPTDTVLVSTPEWIMYGGCPTLWEFDLVRTSGADRLARWTDISGNPSIYSYSPISMMTHPNGSRVVSMVADLAYVESVTNPPGGTGAATLPARARILHDVLDAFGIDDIPGQATRVVPVTRFQASNAPNPFNPVTRIDYSIRQPGHLRLKIYNVRGELVRTLIDTHVETAGHVIWDGTDTDGAQVASGVYFYEARMGRELRTGKMALVK